MDTLFVPNEQDFRRWIKEAIREVLEEADLSGSREQPNSDNEPLLTRKEIAGLFRVSLVTLHDWMKKGLPSHKQEGRVYFLRSEVMEYIKQKRNSGKMDLDKMDSNYASYLDDNASPEYKNEDFNSRKKQFQH